MKRILALILCVIMLICAASLTSCDLLKSVDKINALMAKFDTNTYILDNFGDISIIALKNNLATQKDSSIVPSIEQNFKTLDAVVAFESALFATAKVLENESVKSIVGDYFEEGYTLEHNVGEIDSYILTSDDGVKFFLDMKEEENTDKYSLKCEQGESMLIFSEIVKTAVEAESKMNIEVQAYYFNPENINGEAQIQDVSYWQMNYMCSLASDGKIDVKYSFDADPQSVPQSILDSSYFKGDWKNNGANDINMELSTSVSEIEALVAQSGEATVQSESSTATKSLALRLMTERVGFNFGELDSDFDFSCVDFADASVFGVNNGSITYILNGETVEFDYTAKDIALKIPDFTAFEE